MKKTHFGRPASALVLALFSATAGASESRVLYDATAADAPAWDTARDRNRLTREFSFSELALTADGRALRWRFRSKGVAFNDIFLRREIRRPFDRLRFRIRNRGARVILAAKVRDAGGGEWTANRVPVPGGAEWQWIEFPRERWEVASWSKDGNGRMDFPLDFVALIAFAVEPGSEYDIELARFESVHPDPPVAEVSGLRIPRIVRAGEGFTTPLMFSLDRPCRLDGAAIVFMLDGKRRFQTPIPTARPITGIAPKERVRIESIEVRIPRYAHGGEYTVALHIGDARVRWNGTLTDEEVGHMTVIARKGGVSTSSVKTFNGKPTLFINGEPHNGMAYTAYGPSVRVFGDFTRAGVDLYSFSATPTEAGYGLSRTTWVAPEQYDYSQLDRRILMVLQANPNAYVFPRLYLHAPRWWSEKHPDDLVRKDPGDGTSVPFLHTAARLPAPSWASETWRRDTIEGLRRLIAHVEKAPYADRVIGYHLASGTTEEWMMWGANEGEWVGYSPVNLAKFREWLAEKYGTDAALRRAWGKTDVALVTARVQSKRERQHAGMGSFRIPGRERAVIDFYLYNSELVADTIRVLARAVKEITKGRKTVGVFYGYLLQLCGEQRQQNAGHLALGQVLASPDVDFLCSPTSYAFRQLGGEGTSHFMSLLGSVRLHDKLWFDENDIRTSLVDAPAGAWGRPENVAGDILQQDKELANVLVNGAAQWWFDVGRNRYDDPALMQRIAELTANASVSMGLDHSPVDEVAFAVDEKSLCYLKVGDPLGRELLLSQLPDLHRIGTPVGHYLTEDLSRLSDHKVILLPTSFAPDAAQRRTVDRLKSDGRILVFGCAAGLYRNGAVDEAAAAAFSGIRIKLVEQPVPLRMRFAGSDPLAAGLPEKTYGSTRPVTPVCLPDDPEASVLAVLEDGRPALVVKRFPDWTAVYSAVPTLPGALLRRIAGEAGVHLYIETPDVVWACKDMLAVSVHQPGKRTIRLPAARTIRDLYGGNAEIAARARSMEVEFGARTTRVFVLE